MAAVEVAENVDEQPSKRQKLDDVKSDDVKSDDVKSDDVKSDDVKSDDVKSEVDKENGTKDEEEVEEKPPQKKPSGIPLICGSLNWDTMGRKDTGRVNSKPRKVEPAWTPQIINALADVRVTDLVAGPCAAHSFFITDDHRLFAIGRNEQGQLGFGNTKRKDGPVEIPFFKKMKVIGAAVGKGHSIVLTEDHGAYGMGDNEMGQLGIGGNAGKGAVVLSPKPVAIDQKIKQVACGMDFTLFLSQEGFVFSAGSSESGQLGINDNGEYIEGRKLFYTKCATPAKVHSFFTKDVRTKDVTRVSNVLIRHVSAGQHHSLAISENDELFTWGFNGHGRLGHKTTENELIPKRVLHFRPGDKNSSVKMAECSYGGCFAVNNLGNLFCWGQNQISKLECPYPIPVEDLYGWSINDIAPGRNHHVIAAEFSSISMGKCTQGELGLGSTTKSSSRPDKMQRMEGLKVIKCAAGTAHTLLLASDEDDEAKELLKKLEVNYD